MTTTLPRLREMHKGMDSLTASANPVTRIRALLAAHCDSVIDRELSNISMATLDALRLCFLFASYFGSGFGNSGEKTNQAGSLP